MLPRIVVIARRSGEEKEIIDEIEKIAREVFGENGALPIIPGGVEIIPVFKNDIIPAWLRMDIYTLSGGGKDSGNAGKSQKRI